MNFGGGLNDKFMKKMGGFGLHPFVNGFRSQGVHDWSSLQACPISKIQKIANTINMPPPAVDRLLEKLGKKKKAEPPKKVVKKTVKVVEKKPTKAPPIKNGGDEKIKAEEEEVEAKSEPSKVKDSSYYHFESTPKEMARKFDAKVVKDPTKVEWQTAKGSSSWNPGNTVEDRDFSDQAYSYMKSNLKGVELAEGITISKVTKASGDLTVVSNRGKVKCIYDLSFKAEWSGTIQDDKVSGKIEITDIMADDDDWYLDISSKDRTAKAMIETGAVERLKHNIFVPMGQFFREKQNMQETTI